MIDTHEDDPLLLRGAPLWYRNTLAVILWITALEIVGIAGLAVWAIVVSL